MQYEVEISDIDGLAAVMAVRNTLKMIDTRLIDHGERVAFIASEICKAGNLKLNRQNLYLLCVFHDIGAYKTEEIDKMVEFETGDVWNHAIYGSLFIKYLTPLKNYSQAILYHHSTTDELEKYNCKYSDYAALIFLSDRIDILANSACEDRYLKKIFENKGNIHKIEYVQIFKENYEKLHILEKLKDNSYLKANYALMNEFKFSAQLAVEFLKMVVYTIDFRSEFTVTHTVNTVWIAMNIAKHFGVGEENIKKIYFGSLLHDVGKIAIPLDVLEYPGKLSDEKMKIMRTHVDITRKLIENSVPDDICKIAIRHHEKLDGSGYPLNLKGEELTFSERIVAVADIVSALGSRRSYKEPFPKEKTLEIIGSMRITKLDADICDYICENYDEIMRDTNAQRSTIIRKYKNLTKEYNLLKSKLNNISMEKINR